MSKENEGIVIEARGKYAVVVPASHAGCGQEGCCHKCDSADVKVEMINTISAKEGDKVIYTARESNMLKAVFVVYMLPLILTVAGAMTGYRLAPLIGASPEIAAAVAGVIFFGLSVMIIKLYDRFASTSNSMKPVIIRRAR